MSFKCQKDSYLKEFNTKVVSCEKAKLKVLRNGKNTTIEGRNVVFEDTIIFPEGGGQNDDHGLIDKSIPVLKVTRNKDLAVHFLETNNDLEVGQSVEQTVDWDRRFDNMQQHTGQHIISAIFENIHSIPTTAWWLAENDGKVGISFIELKTESLSDNILAGVENTCNELIRDSCSVKIRVFEKGSKELENSKTRGLPDDVQSSIRVIEISKPDGEVIDSNLCCGTHVSNLSHLQSVKLLYWEKAKKAKGCNLYFLVGNRILNYTNASFKRERAMNQVLSIAPEDHIMVVEKMAKNLKVASNKCRNLIKQIASMDAAEAKTKRHFVIHRPEGDIDYINTFVREVGNNDIFLVVCVGDGPCQLAINGPVELVAKLSPEIITALEAKGGGKGNRINAKVDKLTKWNKVVEIVENSF